MGHSATQDQKQVARFHQLQAEHFASADSEKFAWQTTNAYLARTEQELLERVPVRPADRLLEVGCGEGGNLRLLTELPSYAVGMDLSQAKVRWARRHVAGVAFTCADALRLPFREGSFDLVLCRDVLHHVSDKAGVVGEMVRVCRPDGRLVIIEPNGCSPIMWLLGVVVPAERDLMRNSARRLQPLLDDWPLDDREVTWRQPFPIGRVLFHYRWGLPGLAERLGRLVRALEHGVGRVMPMQHWGYIVITAVKRASRVTMPPRVV